MRKKIGTFLVEKGILSQEQVRDVRVHSEKTGMKFGEAAVDLGLLTQEQLKEVFGDDFQVNFFHIDTKTFPRTTLDLFTGREVAKMGAMPVGIKTEVDGKKEVKFLNIGFLDPNSEDGVQQVIQLVKTKTQNQKEKFKGLDRYLLLPEQFLEVLFTVYGLTEAEFKAMGPSQVHPKVWAAYQSRGSAKRAA